VSARRVSSGHCLPAFLHACSDDPMRWKPVLESVILYLVLAPHDNEVSDLLHR
jgi:hypothetical protein